MKFSQPGESQRHPMSAEQASASVYIPQGVPALQGGATTYQLAFMQAAVAVSAPQAVVTGYEQYDVSVSGSQNSPFMGGEGGHGSGQPPPQAQGSSHGQQ